MGYKCDACSTEDAAVFCFADQAVLCQACDSRLHSANKVAKKHERVSLQKESESATCDICQEHKAIMFCSEDRALICRRCDLMIHTANEFVAKHHRYLLSGVSVGLKALEGFSNEGADAAGKARKPYGLRNTGASGSKDPGPSSAAENPASWRAAPPAEPAGLGNGDRFGSQPSLISVGNPANLSNPALGQLPGASTTFTTPFGRQDEQYTSASPSEASPTATGQDANPFSAWGTDILGGGMRPNSNDFTLAAELLGMPSLSQAFTAKDIDAAYIFDDDKDMEANLSALLEVPDLEALQSDSPSFANQSGLKPVSLDPLGRKRGSPADGVVPELHQDNVHKRQHI